MESYRLPIDQAADDKSNLLAAVSTFFMANKDKQDQITFAKLDTGMTSALNAKITVLQNAATSATPYAAMIAVIKGIPDTERSTEQSTMVSDYDDIDKETDDAVKRTKKADLETEFKETLKERKEALQEVVKSLVELQKDLKEEKRLALKDMKNGKDKTEKTKEIEAKQKDQLLSFAKDQACIFFYKRDATIQVLTDADEDKRAIKDADEIKKSYGESLSGFFKNKMPAATMKNGAIGAAGVGVIAAIATYFNQLKQFAGVVTPAPETGYSYMTIALFALLAIVVLGLIVDNTVEGGVESLINGSN